MTKRKSAFGNLKSSGQSVKIPFIYNNKHNIWLVLDH